MLETRRSGAVVSSQVSGRRTRGIEWSVTTLALLPSLLFCATFVVRASWTNDGHRRFTLFDDAMISMSYGRTLARGGGFVWFVGAPRVEGVTNPLWTVFLAGLHAARLSGSSAAFAVMLVGVGLILATSLAAAVLVARIVPYSRWAPPWAAFAVGLTYPLVFWTLRGMEVGFLALLTVLSVVFAVGLVDEVSPARRPRVLLAAALTAGVATRLDFLLIAAVIVGWAAIALPRERRWPVVMTIAATVGVATVAMTLARYEYFGKVVPNTYVLKLTGVPLLDRIHRGAVTEVKLAPVALLVAIGVLVLWHRVDLVQRKILMLVVAVAGMPVLYSIYVGGDAWEAIPNRYVTPGIVCATVVIVAAGGALASQPSHPWAVGVATLTAGILSLMGLIGLIEISHRFTAVRIVPVLALGVPSIFLIVMQRSAARRALVVMAAFLALAASSAPGVEQWVGDRGMVVKSDARNADYGRFLATVTDKRAVIASVTAGALAYYSDRASIDLLGKSDAYIAATRPRGSFRPGHNKWDYAYSIARLRPDIVAQLFKPKPADFQLLRSTGYQKVCVRVTAGTRTMWVRRNSKRIRWQALDAALCPTRHTEAP